MYMYCNWLAGKCHLLNDLYGRLVRPCVGQGRAPVPPDHTRSADTRTLTGISNNHLYTSHTSISTTSYILHIHTLYIAIYTHTYTIYTYIHIYIPSYTV